jgi:ribonuclease P protein subunit POP4
MTLNLNAKILLSQEFIGMRIKIVKSTHCELCGIFGPIIDETKNTVVIYHKGKPKIVPKRHSTFHCILPDGTIIEIDGELLVGRPEDRIKKKR